MKPRPVLATVATTALHTVTTAVNASVLTAVVAALLTAVLTMTPTVAFAQATAADPAAPVAQASSHNHAAAPATATADLDERLARIDKARGNAKVELMVDLLKQLVAEHKAAGGGHDHAAVSSGGEAHDHAGGGTHTMACPMCAAMEHGGGSTAMNQGAMACPMMAQH